MSLKLALSLAAALALSAASGVARADSSAPSSDKASPHSPSNEEIDAAETGVPASVDYANRKTSKDSPTNGEISAAEAGSPDSPDNKDQPRLSTDGRSNKAWQKLERDNPHSTDDHQ
jgi:hypothetical protein